MRIVFTTNSWEDYIYWQTIDKKILKRINALIKDISREPLGGIGNPESLKYDLYEYWSRRIDREHKLVYQFEDESILIYSCRYHYDK